MSNNTKTSAQFTTRVEYCNLILSEKTVCTMKKVPGGCDSASHQHSAITPIGGSIAELKHITSGLWRNVLVDGTTCATSQA